MEIKKAKLIEAQKERNKDENVEESKKKQDKDTEEVTKYEYLAKGSGSPLMTFINNEYIKDKPLLTSEEEYELSQLVHHGTKEEADLAVKELTERNLGLVLYFAKKYWYPKVDMDDLIQEGVIGLMRAAKKYDPEGYSTKFSTYASYWIKQAMTRQGAEMSNTIRIPAHLVTKRNKINKVLPNLRSELEREPTYEEIVEASDNKVGLSQVKTIMEDIKEVISIEMRPPSTDEPGSNILEIVDVQTEDDMTHVIEDELVNEFLDELLSVLSPREKQIMIMKEGLYGEEPMTAVELGEMYNITAERIRQIHKRAKEKMRDAGIDKKDEILY